MLVGSFPAVLLAGGILVLAVLAAYSGSFAAPFVFDDVPSIAENPTIRHLWPLRPVLHPPSANGMTVGGRPLLNFSLALNYAISGAEVWSYHALNLLIHLLAGLTLFGIVRRTLAGPVGAQACCAHLQGRSKPAPLQMNALALAIALLWTLHPLQTESVTYVVQRAESLMGLFYLLTLYCFVRGATATRPAVWMACSFLACLAGMATKEVMVSAPVLVLLYDRTFLAGSFRGAWRQRGRWHLGLAATWLLLAWLVVGNAGRGGTTGFRGGMAWPDYALTQCAAIPHYLRLAFWPHPLVFDYGEAVVRGAVTPYVLLLVLLLGATVFALWRRPALGFLGAWFFLILAPTSSVVPVATQIMAEHRIYLPLAAVIALAIVGGYALAGSRSLLVWLAAAVGLGWLTARRNVDYRSELTLWRSTVAAYPDNPRAHSNLGLALFESGQLSEAIAQYDAALRLAPDSAEIHNNLGNVLFLTGQPEAAMAEFGEALRLDPGFAKAHYNRGTLLVQLGRLPDAVTEYEAALRSNPDYADAHNNLGNVMFQLGLLPEAIAHYEWALRLEPESAEAHNNLGSALLQSGRIDKAARQFAEALRLRPDYAKARANLQRLQAMRSAAPPGG
jgi:Tfp pilus assembly protein PilF